MAAINLSTASQLSTKPQKRLAAALRQPAGPLRPIRRQGGRLCCSAALSADVVFNIATLGVMPFYAMIIGAPKKPFTRQLMASRWPFIFAGTLYAALLALWNPLPQIWDVFRYSLSAPGLLPNITAFAAAFDSPRATVLSWLHLVTLDLFQARWVYLDSLEHDIPVAHSAVLCFMVGPLGLLCHCATKALVLWRRAGGGDKPSPSTATAAAQ